MRGESRRCKGSNEPLRRLPDGALATRRIFFFGCGAQRARRLVCGARLKKACSKPLTCKAVQAARRRRRPSLVIAATSDAENETNAQLVSCSGSYRRRVVIVTQN